MNLNDSIPDEIIEKIFLNLDVKDMCTACLVCSKWRHLCNSEKIWRKQCRIKNWIKYGYGALDLTYLPSSDKILSRTNVSGTSPKFEYNVEESKLSPIPKWRMIYIKSRFLELNWVKGHYNVLPTLRAHETRVSAFDSDGMVLVSGSTDAVAIWDLDNVILRYKIPIHKDQVNHIQLLGHTVAISFTEGSIKVYDTISSRLLMTFHARCAAEHLRFLSKELIVCSYADK
ncbi:hypothetical protein EB796_014173 [Bugula neritina]|uniref:F-box domain-containing protein n=1 Tax=Bugula neritina TaxID=10212 RepID=A0A7J7JNE5_BUGNE|nr:hypothetical protein EB796_014173 [Bugula neritina]